MYWSCQNLTYDIFLPRLSTRFQYFPDLLRRHRPYRMEKDIAPGFAGSPAGGCLPRGACDQHPPQQCHQVRRLSSESRRRGRTRGWRRDLSGHHGVFLGRRPRHIRREPEERDSLKDSSKFAPTSSSKVRTLGWCKQIVSRASTESMVSIRHNLLILL